MTWLGICCVSGQPFFSGTARRRPGGRGVGSAAGAPVTKGATHVQQGRPAGAVTDEVRSDPQARILTIPNAISVARLAGVPVFLWLVLGVRTPGR